MQFKVLDKLVMLVIFLAGRPWWDSREQKQSDCQSLDVTIIIGDEANQVSDRRSHYVQDESWQKSATVMKLKTFPVQNLASVNLLLSGSSHTKQNRELSIL